MLNRYSKLSGDSKIVVNNASGALVVKGLSLVLSIFTLPVYMNYFKDQSNLGLWLTIVSVLHWFLNFDLGISNGLRNHLTKAIIERNDKEGKQLISSAYFSIGIVCIFVSVLFFIVFPFIKWNVVFAVSSTSLHPSALRISVGIVFIGIMLQLFLKIISSVLYSMQKSSINNLLVFLSSLFTLIAVIIAPSRSNEFNLIIMASINSIAVIIPLIVATFYIFGFTEMSKMKPSLSMVSKRCVKMVLSLGFSFFYVQIIYMVLMNTNPYLITLFAGSENVVDNYVYSAIYGLLVSLFMIALTPIWSIVTKAYVEKNVEWLKRLYHKLLLFAILASFIELMIVPFTQVLVNIWLQDNAIQINYFYALGYAMTYILMIFNSVFSNIANGFGRLKSQIIYFSIGVIIKIPLAYFLVKLTGSWFGVPIANFFAMVPYIINQPINIRRLFFKMSVSNVKA